MLQAQLWRLDAEHGNVLKTYDAMGRPAFLTRDQILRLREAAKPSPPEQVALKNGSLTDKYSPAGPCSPRSKERKINVLNFKLRSARRFAYA